MIPGRCPKAMKEKFRMHREGKKPWMQGKKPGMHSKKPWMQGKKPGMHSKKPWMKAKERKMARRHEVKPEAPKLTEEQIAQEKELLKQLKEARAALKKIQQEIAKFRRAQREKAEK